MERIIRITGITLGMALLLLAVACSAEGPTPTRLRQSQPTGVPAAYKRPHAENVNGYKPRHDAGSSGPCHSLQAQPWRRASTP